MLKGIKKKWTDITIALALPLVIWNGVTGIYNQWEEVQDEKDVPRMIAEQRYGDMLFVWHIWCDDATVGNLIEGYPPSPAVTYACGNIPPIDMPYEEFYNARVNSKYADQLPFSVDPAKDVITQRSAKQTFDIVLGHIFNPLKRFKDGVGDIVNKIWSMYFYDNIR